MTARDKQWLEVCSAMAITFTKCSRKQFAALIVDSRGHLIGSGWNGAPAGYPNCVDGGCPRSSSDVPHGSVYSDCVAVHSEANALLHSDWTARQYSTMYVNGPPCWDCGKMIANSGVMRLVCTTDPDFADWPRVRALLEACAIKVVEFDHADV